MEDDDDSGSPLTPSKYKVFDNVLAKDHDGLLYEAVVRRTLYGPHYHKKTMVGVDDKNEGDDNEPSSETPPVEEDKLHDVAWFYYVHFLGWNVKFDRWIPEEGVCVVNEENKAFLLRLKEEHRVLRESLTRKLNNKKKHQCIDTARFVMEWRKRLEDITLERAKELAAKRKQEEENELKGGSNKKDTPTKGKRARKENGSGTKSARPRRNDASSREWTRATALTEVTLQKQALTRKRTSDEAGAIVLPFSLKKILVEQWEIMQCDQLVVLPAPVSLREALDDYLESKGVKHRSTETMKNEEVTKGEEEDSGPLAEDALPSSSSHKEGSTAKDHEQWKDMANGLALAFDEALAAKLLYHEEQAQRRVIEESDSRRYAEIYGCEHLLRFFVRLPALLMDAVPFENDRRQILAKVNDFVRFLHKHQTKFLPQTYRKTNQAEREMRAQMLKEKERKK